MHEARGVFHVAIEEVNVDLSGWVGEVEGECVGGLMGWWASPYLGEEPGKVGKGLGGGRQSNEVAVVHGKQLGLDEERLHGGSGVGDEWLGAGGWVKGWMEMRRPVPAAARGCP